jgi:hypothetical protein
MFVYEDQKLERREGIEPSSSPWKGEAVPKLQTTQTGAQTSDRTKTF